MSGSGESLHQLPDRRCQHGLIFRRPPFAGESQQAAGDKCPASEPRLEDQPAPYSSTISLTESTSRTALKPARASFTCSCTKCSSSIPAYANTVARIINATAEAQLVQDPAGFSDATIQPLGIILQSLQGSCKRRIVTAETLFAQDPNTRLKTFCPVKIPCQPAIRLLPTQDHLHGWIVEDFSWSISHFLACRTLAQYLRADPILDGRAGRLKHFCDDGVSTACFTNYRAHCSGVKQMGGNSRSRGIGSTNNEDQFWKKEIGGERTEKSWQEEVI